MKALLLLALAAPAFAQDADQGVAAQSSPHFASSPLSHELHESDASEFDASQFSIERAAHSLIPHVLVDERPGRVWVRGRDYRAEFHPGGLRFSTAFGRGPERSFPVQFGLATVEIGDTTLHQDQAQVSRDGDTATLDHGSLREVYHFSLESIEQTFVFDALPDRGELVVTMDVETNLQASFEGTDIVFRHPDLGYVTYGEAVAYDATGSRVTVQREWEDGQLRLRVPAQFVSEASLPLVIDPPINGFSNDFGTPDDTAPDICFDGRSDRYWVVWEDATASTDSDCLITAFDLNGVQGVTATVDGTDDDWREPRIAYHYGSDRLLIVANVTLAGSGVGVVQGRIYNTDTLNWEGTPFAISSFGSVKRYADVGGNSWNSTTNAHMLVTWSFEFSPGNHNPQYRVVDWTGSFITPVLTVDGGGNDDIHTTVSQSLGDVTLSGDFWTMAWTRDSNGDGLGEIWARRVAWNGNAASGAGNFAVDTNSDGSWPSVSSRLDQPSIASGDRPSIVAFQRDKPNGSITQGDIHATIIGDGEVLGTNNVSSMEDVHPLVNQTRPSVATDGDAFFITYQEQKWSTAFETYDMFLLSGHVGQTGSSAYPALSERHQVLAGSLSQERFGRVTMRKDGEPNDTDDGAAVWQIGLTQVAGTTLESPTPQVGDDVAAGGQFCDANGHSGSTPFSAEQSSWVWIQTDQSLTSNTRVRCLDVPVNQFGYLLASRFPTNINMPGGSMGRLCLANAGRYTMDVQNSGSQGTFVTNVNPLSIPQPSGSVSALPGEAWLFQYWHRDSVTGVPTSNFSNAAAVVFAP